jgi:phospholipid/cholesterol/gamma-HCH transport system ATP-binding protein
MAETVVPILEFDSVSTAERQWKTGHVEKITLSLGPGEQAVIRFDPRLGHEAVPDTAMGLAEPAAGEVRFLGEAWQDRRPDAAAAGRGRVGRYFGERKWIYHLDVDENVTLRERHHTRRTLADIHTEANRIARTLGLSEGVPLARPAHVDPRDLQRAACVRMLLGSPPLILFDEPATGLPLSLSDAVAAEIRAARRRGSAVIWMTADSIVWEQQLPESSHQLDWTRPLSPDRHRT